MASASVPVPGAVFAKDERGGPAQPSPRIGDEPGERTAEDRMGLGRGEEVAFAAWSGYGTAVVAAVGVVQGEGHEPRERHRTVSLDLGPHARDEGSSSPHRIARSGGDRGEARRSRSAV